MDNNIKAIRRAKGITLKDVATKLGCSTTWIRMMESGAAPIPSDGTLGKIAAALDVPPALLLKANLKSVPIS